MPDTRVPLPRRPPACILPRASWRLWIEKCVKKVFLTLHVGAGTFLPVKVEDTKEP